MYYGVIHSASLHTMGNTGCGCAGMGEEVSEKPRDKAGTASVRHDLGS